jgi:tRNA-Thr(GGU) m(6)t(6)A37 methyltransferase TsaA
MPGEELMPSQNAPTLVLHPIGFIETQFEQPAGTPIQPSRARGARGRVFVETSYRAALRDLEGFERIWLLYWLHTTLGARLHVKPFLDSRERGLFATRAPGRPNPIGMSAVELLRVGEDGVLDVANVDMINGTPLLDIKPYIPEFDSHPGSRAGWFDGASSKSRLADNRFARNNSSSVEL